jgi:deazaflavin-dependent oxidoreductase (nitroreductase family)
VHLPPALVTAIDRLTQRVYLASDGRLGHRQGRWSVLLLTTTGRRTGEPRIHAPLYFVHRQQLLVVASNNGADRPPAWYLNLVADGEVVVRRGRRSATFTARTATEAERPELWERLTAHHPPNLDHQARTGRPKRDPPLAIRHTAQAHRGRAPIPTSCELTHASTGYPQ